MKIHAQGLQIELCPRQLVDDEDWIRVQVLVEVNGFSGDFEAWLQLGDLERFANGIGAMYESVGKSSTAVLVSTEPDIHINLAMQSLGVIVGTYALESERLDGTPTVLSGAFNIDQSFLPSLHQSIYPLITDLGGKHLL
ncbi:MAG: WapI family immunity protein [Methylococcaceae bacterium]